MEIKSKEQIINDVSGWSPQGIGIFMDAWVITPNHALEAMQIYADQQVALNNKEWEEKLAMAMRRTGKSIMPFIDKKE